jgi:hypothetical protein
MSKKIEWPAIETIEWDMNPKVTTIRNEERVMVRAVVRPTNGCSVGGRHAKQGENFLLVYKRDLPAIQALLPTDEERGFQKLAESQFAAALEALTVELGGDRPGERERASIEAKETIGSSVESFYHRIVNPSSRPDVAPTVCKRRGYPPIESLDINPAPVPPPDTAQSIAAKTARETATAMGEALAQFLGTPTTKAAAAR